MRGAARVSTEGKRSRRLQDVHLAYNSDASQALLTRGEGNRKDVLVLEAARVDVLDDPKDPIEIRGFLHDGQGKYVPCTVTFTPRPGASAGNMERPS